MPITQGVPTATYEYVRRYVLHLTTTPTKGSTLLAGLSNGSVCRLINSSGAIIYYGSIKNDGSNPAVADMAPLANNLERIVYITDIRNLFFAIATGTGNLDVEIYN